ncbi:tail fiber protein [Flavobacterium sp. KACC 22758]|uniref:tail fiber protein n=1 Tax=Flavobacterium sp. KACC 22758 TaxID=3025667 RepID=UPI002366797B|nr:tail fiber protein [Flavobacterium sp. KACC 22758]WDF61878.1 tail fiber protein [Flavobacterium sp. KACC 22758]
MRNPFYILVTFFFFITAHSQTTINQNGLQTTVIQGLTSTTPEAKRYEIANIGYNSFHWQNGGIIIIEIYQKFFSTDYKKYVLQNGYGQGINSGSAVLKLIENQGDQSLGKITLGTPIDISSSYGGYINKQLPVFFDVQNYGSYNIKISYQQQKVDTVTDFNQIKINESPTGTTISNFTVSNQLNYDVTSNGLLRISGIGDHYIQNGRIGIGTISPDEKLTVKGKIHAQEVRVDMLGPLVPDYVFESDYKLKSLEEVESYIRENKHLPEIPSAKEIERNGLMLAEMNMALLKKMEEMTLYIVEQNKKIVSQGKKIEELEKEKDSMKDLAARIFKIEQQLK